MLYLSEITHDPNPEAATSVQNRRVCLEQIGISAKYPISGYFSSERYRAVMVKSLHSRQYLVFRELLTLAREDAGMTQVEVATKLSKPQSYVSKYESGDRRLDVTEFVQIADILSLDISDFLEQYRAKSGVFNSPT